MGKHGRRKIAKAKRPKTKLGLPDLRPHQSGGAGELPFAGIKARVPARY
jgi:hypothetical protein